MTDPKPLVSIITPSYNQVEYLEHTIQSVLRQDYSPIEYAIVDGASSDGSQEVIHKYDQRLAWWVSEPDSGQADAINKGFQRTQGEIFAWLNSDDIYLPGAVRQAVAVMQANPELGFVYADAVTIDHLGRPLNQLRFANFNLSDLIGFRILCQPAIFMRRAVLERAGLLDPSYHFMLDHHLWIRMAIIAPFKHASHNTSKRSSGRPVWAAARQHARAKNVSQALGFSSETIRLYDWMLTQPDLAAIIKIEPQKAYAGASRLKARYLLDAGIYSESLKYYLQALKSQPGYALKHSHRMIFALLSWWGIKDTLERMRLAAVKRRRSRILQEWISENANLFENWPGVCLSNE